MSCPFPGMDPYLEDPAHWPDVHNSLIGAIRDELSPRLAPRYYVGLERRIYRLTSDDMVFIGRPDVAVVERPGYPSGPAGRSEVTVLEVEVPIEDEVEETYLEVREAGGGQVVTVLEVLSPVKKAGAGRREYLSKREAILRSQTSLVEVDLLRLGSPMPLRHGEPPHSDYRLLISRGWTRPRAELYAFGVRQPLPTFPLPLSGGEAEPEVPLNDIFRRLYERVHFELIVDYRRPPVPPLEVADAEWAASRLS